MILCFQICINIHEDQVRGSYIPTSLIVSTMRLCNIYIYIYTKESCHDNDAVLVISYFKFGFERYRPYPQVDSLR